MIRAVAVAWVLTIFCSVASAITMTSELSIDTAGDQMASISHYSYLRDVTLNRGLSDISTSKAEVGILLAGAFNCQIKGCTGFYDRAEYSDVHGAGMSQSPLPQTGSYASHDLQVSFEGDKSISQSFSRILPQINSTVSGPEDVWYYGGPPLLGERLYSQSPNPSSGVYDSWLPCGPGSAFPCYNEVWHHIDKDQVFNCTYSGDC